jgi:hypothetical protein
VIGEVSTVNGGWQQKSGFRVLLLISLTLTVFWSPNALKAAYRPASLLVEAAHAPALPKGESEGRLAYIGSDGNVYVTTGDRRSTIAITNDAKAPPEQQGLSYHRIAWSPNGWLAFAAVTREGNEARSKLYVVESPGRPARVVAESDEHFVGYIYWSPASCPGRPACQRLAYLIREGPDIGLHLVEIDAGGVTDRLLEVGRPLFFSWSADGRRMLWHTGGDRRENPSGRLVLYDVERDHTQSLTQAPGSYLAPAWSLAGEAWLAVSAEGEKNQLRSFGPTGATALVTTSDYEVEFSWSPNGSQVAYALQERGTERVYGPIHIFDLRTGQTRQVTVHSFRILGFFWAPDGQRLAYLTRLDVGDAVWTQWRAVDVVGGRDRGFAAFHPSPWMRSMISGFGQHAQSHRLWSPDGRYLVYSDRDNALVDRVWLVDTWADSGTKPMLVDEGAIGIWSWDA